MKTGGKDREINLRERGKNNSRFKTALSIYLLTDKQPCAAFVGSYSFNEIGLFGLFFFLHWCAGVFVSTCLCVYCTYSLFSVHFTLIGSSHCWLRSLRISSTCARVCVCVQARQVVNYCSHAFVLRYYISLRAHIQAAVCVSPLPPFGCSA